MAQFIWNRFGEQQTYHVAYVHDSSELHFKLFPFRTEILLASLYVLILDGLALLERPGLEVSLKSFESVTSQS